MCHEHGSQVLESVRSAVSLNSHSNGRPRVAVLQDGARLHYALPIALHRAGLLERVFIEFFAAPDSAESAMVQVVRKIRPGLAQRMSQRYTAELPPHRVIRNPWSLLPQQLARIASGHAEVFARRCTDIVGRWVRRHGLGDANVLMGFVRNIDPLLCRFARRRGLAVVADQMIAPASVQNREQSLQLERWPNWEHPGEISGVRDLEHQTWKWSSHLTAASDYVKAGLVQEGIGPERISVLPYPVAAGWYQPVDRPANRMPITVGFVGTVNLRKGVPYFFEVARRLPETEFRFQMVGPIELEEKAVAQHRGAVELTGRKSRQDAARMLDQFDLFFYPSTCEGSAGSVMEAMMAGLPVICSPNTGSVVRDGIDGFIVPYDDVDSAVDKIAQLAANPDRRLEMGRSARARALSFDVDEYSRMLVALFEQLFARPRLGVS
jgi:glycosyltransferase involved in cell wall biosynthesis